MTFPAAATSHTAADQSFMGEVQRLMGEVQPFMGEVQRPMGEAGDCTSAPSPLPGEKLARRRRVG
ncbi:MAG: hypothetical protein AAF235_10495 [Planctomycetota bacterium]